MRNKEDPLVYLTQRDVRELQFAKASISTGWRLLMEQLNLKDEDIQQVLLAGSFGSYLSPASAIQIGLVPKIPVMRIVSAGNVAGEGGKMVLLSQPERNGASALLNEVEYVELSDRADFNDKFVLQLRLLRIEVREHLFGLSKLRDLLCLHATEKLFRYFQE